MKQICHGERCLKRQFRWTTAPIRPLPKYGIYIYASTEEILYRALIGTPFFDELKKGEVEEIPVTGGDILKLLPDGTIVYHRFEYSKYMNLSECRWWDFSISTKNTYIDDIKAVAKYQGYSPDTVDELLEGGFTPDEIEEYIYCME